jgi:DNA mismatch endonuclease (patch repair protein)
MPPDPKESYNIANHRRAVNMTDTHSPATRSYNMSRIRAKDTTPELVVRKFLFSRGYRYRLHVKSIPGNPDIVLTKYNAVIFVNGCFWHGHKGCGDFVTPKSRQKYWVSKLQKNADRDRIHRKRLRALGWQVITVWECQLKKRRASKTLLKLAGRLQRAAP